MAPALRALGLAGAGAVAVVAGRQLGNHDAALAVVEAGYGLLVLFAVANRRLPGLVLLGVGLVANLSVIALDGGMPVGGLPPGIAAGADHHGLSTSDHLPWLADNLPLAGHRFSPGDLAIGCGASVAVIARLASIPRRSPRRA